MTPPIQTIDTHAHYFPQTYIDLIAQYGKRCGTTVTVDDKGVTFIQVGLSLRTGPITRTFIDLDERLKIMDSQGVGMHALSLTQPMVYWADDDLGMQLCVAFNDALAAQELERAAKLPGIKGVYMATAVRDRELSDHSFFPVYERCEALGLPIFLHPMMINNERLKQFYLINLCGNPFDTAIAASHLIFGGVLDAFPKLEISLPHGGGVLPILRGRLDRGFHMRMECKTISKPPSTYLKRFTYDTITYDEALLEDLIKLVGADRILVGSDYCFDIAYEEPVRFLNGVNSLTGEQKQQILWRNAAKLLNL